MVVFNSSIYLKQNEHTYFPLFLIFSSRCVCPGHTVGPYCKIASRSFSGNGFAWLSPLPPCSPTMISLKFLTTADSGLLLYSGPLSRRRYKIPNTSKAYSTRIHYNITDNLRVASEHYFQTALAIQLKNGKLQVIVETPSGEVLPLTVNSTHALNDGLWHQVHLKLTDKVNFNY